MSTPATIFVSFAATAIQGADVAPTTRADLLEGFSALLRAHFPHEADKASDAANAIREAEAAQLYFFSLATASPSPLEGDHDGQKPHND